MALGDLTAKHRSLDRYPRDVCSKSRSLSCCQEIDDCEDGPKLYFQDRLLFIIVLSFIRKNKDNESRGGIAVNFLPNALKVLL